MLDKIHGHSDLIGLSDSDRECLCREIRQFLVENIARTGGHLASNLGVVELTVAIETVFNTQSDRLVFDVGHQSYVHKLLTGRQAGFDTLRTFGGIAGFPKPGESQTDAFVAGHASSSVSIALGMARARTLMKEDYHVVALLGDGAATGGMVYEGLNDAAESGEPMVVILNDNEMSIDPNVGGMARHLSRLRTKSGYLGAKRKYRTFVKKLPGGQSIYNLSHKLKRWFRRILLPTTIFENMGMTYFGPINGHDLPELISVLQSAKEMGGPVLIHVLTQKGMGYAPAEENPSLFHGIGAFDPYTGRTANKNALTFSDAFGNRLCDLAEEDSRICAITAAMPGGTGLLHFKEKFPDRLFDVGIAEEHAISMAGGLAKQGMVPVVALYSTFLQRGYDQLMQDIALLGLHVVLAVDRAGLVGEDGETHHGVFDAGFLRQIPGMRVLTPATTQELQDMLRWAVRECDGPVAIRYPRGTDRGQLEVSGDGPVAVHRDEGELALVSYGVISQEVLEAAQMLSAEGMDTRVIRLRSISPLPEETLFEKLQGCRHIVMVEEACRGSGIYEQLAAAIHEKMPSCRLHHRDLGNGFVTHGNLKALYKHCGLDADSLKDFVKEVIGNEN